MTERESQIRSLIIGCIILYALGYAAATITFYWLQDESPQQAYERGYKDASWFVVYDIEANPTVVTDNLGRTWYRIDSTDGPEAIIGQAYMTVEIASPSEIVRQIIDDDTLSFYRIWTDTGYVLKPIYRVRKLWTPEDSDDADSTWKEWFDTSRGWTYFDSTDTMPVVESIHPDSIDSMPRTYPTGGAWDSRTKPTTLWDTGGAR